MQTDQSNLHLKMNWSEQSLDELFSHYNVDGKQDAALNRMLLKQQKKKKIAIARKNQAKLPLITTAFAGTYPHRNSQTKRSLELLQS